MLLYINFASPTPIPPLPTNMAEIKYKSQTAFKQQSKLINSFLQGNHLALTKTVFHSPMIQNTVDPAEARIKRGRLISRTSPYCSTRLNSRPANSTKVNFTLWGIEIREFWSRIGYHFQRN